MADLLHAAIEQIIAGDLSHLAGKAQPYQCAVTEALLAGRRVVLRAPAGSGKTLASWLPWLVNRESTYDFPPQLLHILPDNSLPGPLKRRLAPLVQQACAGRVSVQTESEAFDPFFLSDAVITSMEHLLSVALHRPLGLHPNLANIDAGAIYSSYLIFDDFPALAHRDTLVLWLGLLRQYYPLTPCLFSASSLPRPLLQRIAELLDAEFIDAGDVDTGGRRVWQESQPLSADAIARLHRRRTIVVCNTVRGAQMLYRKLKGVLQSDAHAPDLLLQHQYLLHRERQQLEARIAHSFGNESANPAMLVTTSAIEVGSLSSADLVITDPAPPDMLLRRGGRCARFAGEEGRVIVARVTQYAPGEIYPTPPGEEFLASIADGAQKSSADELAAFEACWHSTEVDTALAAHLELPPNAEIDQAPRELLAAPHLFPERYFTRVGASLHRTPEAVQDPFALERFSLALSSVKRGFRQWNASGCYGEWFALTPQWPQEGQRDPRWDVVENPDAFRADARLIMLNADAISYDPEIGLELEPGVSYQSLLVPAQQTTWSPFDQHIEQYQEHARRALQAIESQSSWYNYILRRLARRWNMPLIELNQWLRLGVLWHDAGKLTEAWQRAAFRWQAEGIRRPYADGVLGRVDFQSRRDSVFPCPLHAGWSGVAVSRALLRLYEYRPTILQGTINAICHHHGFVTEHDAELAPHADAWPTLTALAALILDDAHCRHLARSGWAQQLYGLPDIAAAPPLDPDVFMAYSVLVRAIRLADREVALSELFVA